MKLSEALSCIYAPKGQTSIIAALMSGNTDPIQAQDAVGVSLSEAIAKLRAVEKAQNECGSDWAYWGYEGDRSYWSAVVSILEAAALVGADKLPNVRLPNTDNKVVMDACYEIEDFGKRLLAEAKELT